VWIGHLRRKDGEPSFKLPAAMVLAHDALPEIEGYEDIRYEENGAVGILHFPFYNGAMSTGQCHRLLAAYRSAL
jgi:putative two-component system hydrogenase maturation factor HypX/HoxX